MSPEAEIVFVAARTLSLRSEPNAAAQVTATLPQNASLVVLSRQEGWVHVLTEDEQEGWVIEEFVAPEPSL